MQIRRRIFLLLFMLCTAFTLTLNAATFYVTTNADSGTGSLRDAILQSNSNGTSTTDNIYFNIVAVNSAGVNITLLTELPALTSNIVIDGTTQPLSFLNSTSIKIQLSKGSTSFINGLTIKSIDHVEIYGINFNGFDTNSSTADNGAIFLNNGSDIVIGAPNKGNSFGGNYAGIFSPSIPQLNERIKIQSNYFGFSPNGTLLIANSNGIDMSYSKELLIGGSALEGNYFGSNSTSGMSMGASQGIVRIINNKVGLDITGKFVPSNTANGIYVNGLQSTIIIEDNIVVGQKKGLFISDVGNGFSVRRNRVGTGPLGTEVWGNLEVGIEVYQGSFGAIGGLVDADKNYIAYNRDGIFITRSYPITITKNSIYCNSRYPIKFEGLLPADLAKIAIPNVVSIQPNSVKGTFNPGGIVELFEDDQCSGCSGKTLMASLIADASGNWSYTGVVSNPITVTGTNTDGATSTFSSPAMDETKAKIADEHCGKVNGSVTGIIVFNADEFKWYDTQGTLVSTDKDLVGMKAGIYYLVARQQGNCSITSSNYQIRGVNVAYKITKATTSPSACGKSTGSIIINSFEFAIPPYFKWLNEKDEIISTDQNVANLAPGTYRVFGDDRLGCENLIETFLIGEVTDIAINSSKVAIYNTSCLKDEGSIFNLTVTGGTTPYAYEWFDMNDNKVGSDLNLLTMPSAKYYLKVTDVNGCQMQTQPFTIPPSPLNVKLPDSFSPNGDGINDVWRVPGLGSFRNTEIKIFNRYGAIVFLSRNNEKEFNGTQNDKDLPIGIYYYIITLNNNCSDIIGNIMLIR
jgi:gliding motility-associated-like protein